MPLTRSGSKQAMDAAAALLVGFGDDAPPLPARRRSFRKRVRGPARVHRAPTPPPETAPHTPKRAHFADAGAVGEPNAGAPAPSPQASSAPSTPLDLLAGVADRVAVGRTHTPPARRRVPSTPSTDCATAARGTLALHDRSNAQAVQMAKSSEWPLVAEPTPGFLVHALSSVRALVAALESDATRPLLCDDSAGGRIRAAVLDEMFRSAPVSVIERVCPRWRTDETTIRALAHYHRHDILSARRRGGHDLAASRSTFPRRNEVVLWCEVSLFTAASVATVEAAEGLGVALHERALLLQRTAANVLPGAADQALRAFASTLSLYGRGSVGGRMLDALALRDASAVHAFASRHHASLCALAATGAIERVAAANFVLALLERATASAKALECFRQWTQCAYGTASLDGLLLALQARGAAAAEIARSVGCLATVRDVDAYAWVEKRAVDGEWLHAVFSRAGQAASPPWSAWGATCAKCDVESRGKAPIVAIATLVAAVGLEPTGQAHGAASNEVVRLALGSLIAWLSDVARREEAEKTKQKSATPSVDPATEKVGPVAAEVTGWVASLLWKIASRGGALIEAATRDVADEARARGATPPSMKILERAMAPAAELSPVC